ncbi:hypothetical protein BC831DRAFT_444596 [Entophlyctis helioformis]|nr:hypothetical protein BC831DRAFT_444596 [Entophlyctis helioformis]
MSANSKPAGRELHVSELSSKIKTMKFMNRANEARIRENLEKEQRVLDEQASWVLESVDRSTLARHANYEVESSYMSFIEVPSMARKSFKSFNTAVEKMADESEKEARLQRARENEKREQITDEDMASRYRDHIGGSGAGASAGASKGKRKQTGDGVAGADTTAGDQHAQKKAKSPAASAASKEPVDWSKERGRNATRFAAGQFIKPRE